MQRNYKSPWSIQGQNTLYFFSLEMGASSLLNWKYARISSTIVTVSYSTDLQSAPNVFLKRMPSLVPVRLCFWSLASLWVMPQGQRREIDTMLDFDESYTENTTSFFWRRLLLKYKILSLKRQKKNQNGDWELKTWIPVLALSHGYMSISNTFPSLWSLILLSVKCWNLLLHEVVMIVKYYICNCLA